MTQSSNARSRFARWLAGTLAALPLACAAPPKKTTLNEDPKPIAELVEATNKPSPIGKFLADVDASIRAWDRLLLAAASPDDRATAARLEKVLMTATHNRRAELIQQLESGPLNNRIVAACALGFTRDAEAQSPLLAALEDSHPEVVTNALYGLFLLGRADTPLEAICRLMQSRLDEGVRRNAAQCAAVLVEAGARSDCILPAARLGLSDSNPGVRAQCALIVATLLDESSMAALADRLHDSVPLVRAAAARAIGYIGAHAPAEKGTAARALAKAYEEASAQQRGPIHAALVVLAGIDQGSEARSWTEWAHKLP